MPTGDGHRACFRCLGLAHARAAVANPMLCQACDLLGDRLRAARLEAMENMFEPLDPSPDDRDLPPSGTVRGSRSAPVGRGDGGRVPARGAVPPAVGPPAAKRRREEQLDTLEHRAQWVGALEAGEDDDDAMSVYASDDPDLLGGASVGEAAPSSAGSEESGSVEPLTARESMRSLLERVAGALHLDLADPDGDKSQIPMCPQFAAAFRESWFRMGRTGQQARFRPSREAMPWTRLSDQESVGIDKYPAMDNVVAATFLSDAEIIGDKGPQLKAGKEKDSDQLLQRTFNVLSVMARLNNAAMLLSSYLAHLVPNVWCLQGADQDWTDEALEVSRLLVLLQSEVVRANGQAVASVVESRRRLWLSLSGLEPHVQKAFCGLPFTPGVTFGSGVDDILRKTEDLRRDRDTLTKFQGFPRQRGSTAPRRPGSQGRRGLSASMQRRLGTAPHQPQAQTSQYQAQTSQYQAQPRGQGQSDRGRGRQRRRNKARGGSSALRGRSSGKNPGPQQST